jgi:putative methionine-R-sulfoxide reductase with GAF domain
LAVLKARDADMLSQRWQESSKNVRMLSDLITKWVFEDFEIWTIRKNLSNVRDWMQQLEIYLQAVLPENENKASIIEKAASILKVSKNLLEKYEGYYLTEETIRTLKAWKHTRLDNPNMVHDAVNDSVQELLKNRKP